LLSLALFYITSLLYARNKWNLLGGIEKPGRDRREPLGSTAGQGYPDPQENITLGSSLAAVPVLASAEDFTQRF